MIYTCACVLSFDIRSMHSFKIGRRN